ncbi:myomegalin isoform X2 [Lacerta agilis]|uniref:myomegalin isoform X2 n=1 Tax=Lacerta agilis TaxID=80427 RepID=UPI00141A1805|nr:myomegalin isoform X2 [Lacerta agilis]
MRSEWCRVCGRALCGTHRRWLFHGASGAPPPSPSSPSPAPCSRPSLQVLLSHATGREVSRDGRAEFACGKCAFLLERVYRFDTVIARVEALSLERLQRLLLEKERLKLCLAALYRRTNGAPEAQEGQQEGAWDARYLALLQEDFAFSGLECWTEGETRADEQPPGAPRRCRGCAALRVADADYEAVCRVPRRAAKSGGQPPPKRHGDGESLDDEAAEAEPDGPGRRRRRAEEAGSSSLESLASGPGGGGGGGLAVALSLLKAFGCKPVRSPRGSRLPVPARRGPEGAAGSLGEAPSASPTEAPELRELWEELCADYVPLRPKYLFEDQQQLTLSNLSQGKQASELNNVELLEKISCLDATNKQLQEKLNEMDFELKSVQHTSQRQDHKIQTLNVTLKSKENESEELYRVIEGQNETIAKLQDTLHKTQLGQFQIPGGSSMLQQTQPAALLEVQNTLFFTQLEVQQLKMAQQKKDLQLAEARKTSCLVETWLQEEEQQKEAAWKHNQELRCALQQVRTKLQNKNWQCCTLERERWSEMQKQELKLKHLKHSLACREQLLQESKELIQYHQSLDKSPTSADNMVKKLQQRIKDRDAILERAVDEKFCVLEDKEQELQQLRLAVKEREHDLEELRRVLSHNEATIQGLESLLKAKGLELEQLLTSYQNLRWLKEEVEAKSLKWQAEQEGTIRQLQTALHDRNKKVEVLSAKLLCKLGPGQRELVEELYLCLQQKEQIIEELLSDKSRQTMEQMAELQELLQAVNTREQQSCISSEKMARALIERSCELQDLRQQLQGQLAQEKMEASTAQLLWKDESEALRQESSSKSPTTMTSKDGGGHFNVEKGAWEATAGLEEELTGAKEQLELLTRKEKESRLELAALQSVLVSQEEELQVQASDVESLTRSIQIKEELIKDLQMQLVDPEEMPVVERLSQEVLMLQEKVARMEQQGQEVAENRRLQLLQVLEGLAAEKNQLNETLKAEKQLYSTLVKFQAHPDSLASSQHEQTLQVELDRVQAIRGQLEEALGRSLAHLSRLESLDGIGGPVADEDAEDASTEFTDSIEEEAQRTTRQQHAKEGADGTIVGQTSCPAPSLEREKSLQAELLYAKSETQQVREQKKKLEGELQHLKGQVEEAGFSSISQLRKALLSLCLENAELKEQVGEAMLSEGWENEDEKEEQEDLKLEVRKLQEKLHSSEMVIGLLKEQLTLSSQADGSIFQQQVAAGVTQESERLQVALQGSLKGAPHDSAPQQHCPRPQSVDTSLKETQIQSLISSPKVWEVRLGSNSWQQLRQPVHLLPSELPQCKQQCHRLRGKLLVSEATVLAQVAQLEQYRALLSEPTVQQDTKQIQVDLQDLGYETCGKSENEADREEATSPECEEHAMFHEELKPRKNMLGSPPSPCDDAAILRQQVRDLQLQLQSSHRVIQNLQGRVRSISAMSDCGSGGERPLRQKPGYARLGSSPSHSMTEEDEGWYSDSLGSFCPASLQPNRDLARLIQRVSLLEAHLGESKTKGLLAEELKPAASMGKYDSLVQAQARELSHLRQVIREGRGVCHLLKQHFQDTIKSFEELLRGTDFDYLLGQSFREKLAQGSQWAERLASKLNRRNDLNMEDKSNHELLTLRLSKELQEKEQTIQSLQAKLHLRSVTPSSSRTISESPRSGSSTSFLSEGLDSCSDMDEGSERVFYQADPSENQPHSLQNKDCYSSKSSAQPSPPPAAATSPAAPAEPIPRNLLLSPSQATQQPCRGPHPDSLSKPAGLVSFASSPCSFLPLGRPPPPPAPAPLLGCCRVPVFSLAEAQQELQLLQKQLGERVQLPALPPVKSGSLAGILSSGSPAVSSKPCLQACPHVLPTQNSAEWNRKSEGWVGESNPPCCMYLNFREPQEKRCVSGILPSCSSATLSSQKLSAGGLLEEHLSEIQILRQRLEESISANDHLREQLEKRLSLVPKSHELEQLQEALRASHSKLHDGEMELHQQRAEQQRLQEEIRGKRQDFVHLQEEFLALQKNNSRLQHRVALLQHQCEQNQLHFQTLQAELQLYKLLCGPQLKVASGTHRQENPVLLDDISNQGSHVISHLKDYSTLKKQILEGKTLIHKMASLLHPGQELQQSKIFCQERIRQLLANTSSLHQILEKSSSLLATFWRATLPGPHISAQEPSLKEEIQALRARLEEPESRLRTAGHGKESMESVLLSHLTRTYDVLRKARMNLEGMSPQPLPSCEQVLA